MVNVMSWNARDYSAKVEPSTITTEVFPKNENNVTQLSEKSGAK